MSTWGIVAVIMGSVVLINGGLWLWLTWLFRDTPSGGESQPLDAKDVALFGAGVPIRPRHKR